MDHISQISSDLVGRRDRLIEAFVDCMGRKPDWGRLDQNLVETNHMSSFTIESVRFSAENGEEISSILLTPDDAERPLPVVLCHHGFYSNKDLMLLGKDADGPSGGNIPLVQLTRFGFAVIAIDGRAHGTRRSKTYTVPWEHGKAATVPRPSRISDPEGYRQSIWEDFEWLNREAIIDGTSIAALETWDAVRTIDYLETRRDIDIQRVGTFGHSRGGDIAWYLGLVDPRVRAICTSGCMQTFEACIQFRRDAGAHAWIPGIRKIASRQELVSALAPRPLLALEGRKDHHPSGERPMWNALTSMYAAMGVPTHFKYHRLGGGHGEYLNDAASVDRISRWFTQWL